MTIIGGAITFVRRKRVLENRGSVQKHGVILVPEVFLQNHDLLDKKFYQLHFREADQTLFVTFQKDDAKTEEGKPFRVTTHSNKSIFIKIKPIMNLLGLKTVQPGKVELSFEAQYKALKVSLKENLREHAPKNKKSKK